MNREKQRLPRTAERGCSWAVTFLLMIFLTLTILSFTALRMITSAGLHLSVAADDSLLDHQMQEICANIDLMAAEYGFPADEVKATVSRDELKEFNRKTAEWWTRLLTEGEGGVNPRWYSGSIEDIVYAAAGDQLLREEEPQTVVTELTKMIEYTVFPIRETTVAFGSKFVKDRVDIKGIIRSVQKLPMLCLMASLACAGLIALLLGREPFLSVRHYGTAAAASGLTVLAACITFLAVRPLTMITEASAGLAEEFGTLTDKGGAGMGAAAVFLLAAGYLCLILYRRKTGRTSRDAEQEA